MAGAYYNEVEPFMVEWLRNLIRDGHIAPGDVDERPIQDVAPDDLRGYTQCHFFAGLAAWSLGLRQAGWADDREVWTGSCPCQPFSAAGKGGGFADERHLWPYWHHLIRVCRPPVVLGEQVASKDGLNWFDLVSADLEGEDHAVGASDLCVAGLGGPHIRQRLWIVAKSNREHDYGGWGGRPGRRSESSDRRSAGPMAIPNDAEWGSDGSSRDHAGGSNARREEGPGNPEGCSESNSIGVGLMANADGRYTGPERQQHGREHGQLSTNDDTADREAVRHLGVGPARHRGHRTERRTSGRWRAR